MGRTPEDLWRVVLTLPPREIALTRFVCSSGNAWTFGDRNRPEWRCTLVSVVGDSRVIPVDEQRSQAERKRRVYQAERFRTLQHGAHCGVAAGIHRWPVEVCVDTPPDELGEHVQLSGDVNAVYPRLEAAAEPDPPTLSEVPYQVS